MKGQIATHVSTALEAAVLETVAYSDVFDFPLSRDEVRRYLPIPADLTEVKSAVEALVRQDMLIASGSYVTLQGREHIVELRDRRRQTSAALRKTAERYGALIAHLPFVRMVAITGSLAAENADEADDLDYLIVSAPGRLWLTRAMTMAVVRFAALRGVTLCPNYLLSEAALALPERDLYTARELRQMAPVAGHDVYARMLAANAWWRSLLPNAEEPLFQLDEPGASLPRRISEWLLRRAPFDRMEAWILAHKGAELRRGAGPEAVFNDVMCKGHTQGWREQTLLGVQERLKRLPGMEQ